MTRRTQAVILGAALILFFSLTILTIRTLRPWVDEAWAGAPAWSLATKGFSGTPSLDAEAFGRNGLTRIDRVSYWIPPLFVGIQALWYRLVPFSLGSMRSLSMLCGLAGLCCWYIIVKRLTGDVAAATLLFALMSCDYIAVSAASFGRADAMSFGFQSAAYASFLSLREKRLDVAILLSQTFVVASGLSHPNGGVLAFFGLLFITLYFERSRIGWKQIMVATAPYAVGSIAWGNYILHDPEAFIAQYSLQTGARFFEVFNPLQSIRHEAGRYIQTMGLGAHSPGSIGPHALKALNFLSYAAALAGVLLTPKLRKSDAVRVLAGLVAIYLVYYTFFEGTKATYYFIYLVYVYAALLAVWLTWCWREFRWSRMLILPAVALLIAIQIGGLIQRARLDHYHNGYLAAVNFLRESANPNDLIAGSHELGFALGFQDHFIDDYRIGLASGKYPDYIVVEEIYLGRFEMLQQQRPEEYLKLQELLKQYREVYNHDFYTILTRKPG